MRHLRISGIVAVSALVVASCSDAPDTDSVRRLTNVGSTRTEVALEMQTLKHSGATTANTNGADEGEAHVAPAQRTTTLQDDLDEFWSFVETERKSEGGAQEVRRRVRDLREKYRRESYATFRILVREASAWRLLDDDERAAEVLEHAKDVMDEIKVQRAIDEMELLILTGNTYYGHNEREKAMYNFKSVLDFPVVGRPWSRRAGELRELYIEAALRVTELTPLSEAHRLHFIPFAKPAIWERFPRHAERMPVGSPLVPQFRRKVAQWLEIEIREQGADSPVTPHLEGVLKYIRSLEPVPPPLRDDPDGPFAPELPVGVPRPIAAASDTAAVAVVSNIAAQDRSARPRRDDQRPSSAAEVHRARPVAGGGPAARLPAQAGALQEQLHAEMKELGAQRYGHCQLP